MFKYPAALLNRGDIQKLTGISMEKQSARRHIRTIRIGRTQFPVVSKPNTNSTGFRIAPWIRLRGIWLQDAGFLIGQTVSVTVQHERIVITVD